MALVNGLAAVVLFVGLGDGPIPWPLPELPDPISNENVQSTEYNDPEESGEYDTKETDLLDQIDDLAVVYDAWIGAGEDATDTGGMLDGIDSADDFDTLAGEDFSSSVGYSIGVMWAYAKALRGLPSVGAVQLLVDVMLGGIVLGLAAQAIFMGSRLIALIVRMLFRLFEMVTRVIGMFT